MPMHVTRQEVYTNGTPMHGGIDRFICVYEVGLNEQFPDARFPRTFHTGTFLRLRSLVALHALHDLP